MARKYEPIWEALKAALAAKPNEAPKVAVAAPAPLHRRIIKGVLKEKNNDLGFKVLEAENRRKWVLRYITNQSKITLILKSYETFSIKDL